MGRDVPVLKEVPKYKQIGVSRSKFKLTARRGLIMVTYTFECDDELWREWKDTVPRSTHLDERIRQLIAADKEGRVDG